MSEETKREPLYKAGNKVTIVNYGHLTWINKKLSTAKLSFPLIGEDENFSWHDMSPEMVGQNGIVVEAKMTQGIPCYAIHFEKGRSAWYDEKQMELTK